MIMQICVVCNICYFIICFKLILGNESIYEIIAYSNYERAQLYQLHLYSDNVNFLNGITAEAAIPTEAIVGETTYLKFENKLTKSNIQFKKLSELYLSRVPENDKFRFLNWDEINMWVDEKLEKYPVLKKIVIATTYEKREIFILKLTRGKKPASVFILGGEEGRDWQSPAIILELIAEMLENKTQFNPLMNFYEFYFLPLLNPDGYEYSRLKDRLWAKNRKEILPRRICPNKLPAVGVNLDRNWFFDNTDYGRDSECHSVYFENKPLSEEETLATSIVLNKIALNLMAFINIRGFSRIITIPYANTNMTSNNFAVLFDILKWTCTKLKNTFNVTYYAGNTAKVLYNVTGNSADWVKKTLNIPIVFTTFMESGDTFLPSAEDTEQLTAQFTLIINDTLLIAKDIYGALFNCQCRISSFEVIILLLYISILLLQLLL